MRCRGIHDPRKRGSMRARMNQLNDSTENSREHFLEGGQRKVEQGGAQNQMQQIPERFQNQPSIQGTQCMNPSILRQQSFQQERSAVAPVIVMMQPGENNWQQMAGLGSVLGQNNGSRQGGGMRGFFGNQ